MLSNLKQRSWSKPLGLAIIATLGLLPGLPFLFGQDTKSVSGFRVPSAQSSAYSTQPSLEIPEAPRSARSTAVEADSSELQTQMQVQDGTGAYTYQQQRAAQGNGSGTLQIRGVRAGYLPNQTYAYRQEEYRYSNTGPIVVKPGSNVDAAVQPYRIQTGYANQGNNIAGNNQQWGPGSSVIDHSARWWEGYNQGNGYIMTGHGTGAGTSQAAALGYGNGGFGNGNTVGGFRADVRLTPGGGYGGYVVCPPSAGGG